MNRFSLTLLLLLVTAIWGWTFTMVKEAVEAYLRYFDESGLG